ncbi:alpha/beta hydrolase [Actinopolymorpha sp. B17G11]|uniref:alpha/beta hydrolase n=1 Tax=Actinopolymorpha sp. B17G11 TaxID=3160861 RepID=UPI0032E44010
MMIPATGLLIDPRRRAWKGDAPRPITTYLWPPAGTPTGGTVVLSHGTGGSGLDLGWLAEQLAAAGLRVIAVDHHGNNYPSGYHAEGFVRW